MAIMDTHQPTALYLSENLYHALSGSTWLLEVRSDPFKLGASIDINSGVRFFGPTTSMNLLSVTTLDKTLERHESHWPIALILPDLTPEAHDYLMEIFWTCHNSGIHLVHKDAFYDDQQCGGTRFYSVFLHVCMLAISLRYASKDRQDIQRLVLKGQVSSTLHMKAKCMAKTEIERPGGIPSIQALFLLADIECMSGRDDTGWMFAGKWLRLFIGPTQY
jgi:hypothetical protein